ncbi:MAG: endonuclease/exonuclease/phosphatase family protein [Gemmatimonadota bacterium]
MNGFETPGRDPEHAGASGWNPAYAGLGTLLAFYVLALAGCEDPNPASPEPGTVDPAASELLGGTAVSRQESALRLYTRNVFLGGDTDPLFTLDFQDTSPRNLVAIVTAVNTFWGQVQATDFPARAAAIADDIARTRPHVVGLNEMARYTVVDATTGALLDRIDFTTVLLDALSARGLAYRLEIDRDNISSQLPLALGPTGPTRALAFTLGDVTLVRSDLDVTDKDSDIYRAEAPLSPTVALRRGWSRVSFPFEGVTHHVVVTNLESQRLRPVHDGQAAELIGTVLADLAGPTVVMGDLNSDAANGPGAPSYTPTYERLLAEGFVDAWLERSGQRDDGFTCCWNPDLKTGTLDERIDFILVRAPDAAREPDGEALAGSVLMDIRGDEESDRLSGSGLFPTDHAGLFASVNLPRVLRGDR